jgi:DNA modification methylase
MYKKQQELPNMPSKPQIEMPLEGISSTSSKPTGPVTCLGLTFENDGARRAHFTELLREMLDDPDFRAIEGFPLGEDEDILALSDPPYYTACPNPWVDNFIQEWEAQKPEEQRKAPYHREPFAADVSEGKNHPIYYAHSYHTKVPHRAIMRYILHYTEPGDIVFDGFCGAGMTGVAAQMCADKAEVEALGYRVDDNGTVLQHETDEHGAKHWTAFSKLGTRQAVLNDLSPAATFIAYNYNTPLDMKAFKREADHILAVLEAECGWMYETKHVDGRIGKINYTVWSDVFICPECSEELVFWDAAVNKKSGKVNKEFPCYHCGTKLTKRNMERAWTTRHDVMLGETIRQIKQIPVLIDYKLGKKRLRKIPDEIDLALIDKILNERIPYYVPINRMMLGGETRRNDPVGITHVHHFYYSRPLYVLAFYKYLASSPRLLSKLTSSCLVLSKLYRFRSQGGQLGAGGGPMSGTLYIPSLVKEIPVLKVIKSHVVRTNKLLYLSKLTKNIQTTSSMTDFKTMSNSIDYIFLDPPFGSNLNYSELSFLWESWLKVWTDNDLEAIENKVQGKELTEYRELMTACFKEAYRLLKPGRWLTIEFSNTKAAVWNSIQTALTDAGFIVANVSALDKQQGSFKAVTTTTAVKQDLVISAYKPNGGFTDRFQSKGESEAGVWDFMRTHLGYLPVVKTREGALLQIPERDPRILYDQVVAYYVRNDFFVPLSSPEFQAGLRQRFAERDGMFFLPEQVAHYDRKKLILGEVYQMSAFVSDEESAIHWLRQHLKEKPQTYQDIHPQYIQEAQRSWKKNEKPIELSTLLDQNFIPYDGKEEVPAQIHSYLSTNWKEYRNMKKGNPLLKDKAKERWYVPDPNKAGDLEKLRERSLMREFEKYIEEKKKLKIFRLEAVRAGFKNAWQARDYQTIVAVAEKIPHNVLEEDPKLLMWYDQAVTRMGG